MEIKLPNKPLINVSEALPFFDITDKTFRLWIEKDYFPTNMIIRNGNTIKIRTNILEKYLLGDL